MMTIKVWLLIAVSANSFLHGTPTTLADNLASREACEETKMMIMKEQHGKGMYHCVPATVVVPVK